MKHIRACVLVFLTVITLGYIGTAAAQENLAQQALAVMEAHCFNCHGPDGAYTENLLIDSATGLTNSGAIVPGDPDISMFYQRLLEVDPAKRMPLGGAPLSNAAIQTIENWIQAGAPSWKVRRDVTFITNDEMLTAISEHLETLDPFVRSSARYFTMTNLYNAGELPETLHVARVALSKLVNSLSWGHTIVNPEPIDAAETIFYIDLRAYEWDTRDAWSQIETAYPYVIEFDATTRPVLHRKFTALREAMVCEVPFVHVDWFLAEASLPPLYHDILSLPETESALERELGIDVAGNLRRAPGLRVMRAGTNDSGVSAHNRVVERHSFRNGAYWKSHDFASSVGLKNILQNPLSFDRDGGEVIFNLPNGLQAYYVSDGAGNRIDVAPTAIVSNPAASDPAVRNGLSCIGCHTEGMKTFEDVVRSAFEEQPDSALKTQVLRLYVPKADINRFVAQDTARYKRALEETGGVFGEGIEPVHHFHEAFQKPLTASYAAASVGLEVPAFMALIRENGGLQSLGLTGLLSGGNVKRDAWTVSFSEIVACVYNDACPISTPVVIPYPTPVSVERPRIIRDPSNLVPDVNLRAAIAETLGKPSGALLKTEDIARLTELVANEKGIRDLTGLEYATNLERIEFGRNAISDLTPLKGLRRLNTIVLYDNRITDVSPLADLTSNNIGWLGLSDNQIIDVSPLKNLKKLKNINISGNPITDVSPLASVTSLESVEAWHISISDFSVLAKLPRLRRIILGGTTFSKLPAFKGLKTLRYLEIVNTSISDISGLSELTQLTELYLEDNFISDISPLSNLKELTHLQLNGNLITDVSPLAGLTKLKHLELANNAITDFSPLKELSENIYIRTQGNPGTFPQGGPKIKGPWLWLLFPGFDNFHNRDLLARTSGGDVTELEVATNGATEGQSVGDKVWTSGTLPSDSWNNIKEMLGARVRIGGPSIVYGSIAVDSPREQKTKLFAGSGDHHKVWLNGQLINEHYGWSDDYQIFVPVTLKQGKNVLLIAVYKWDGHLGGHFGFAPDAEYTVLSPGARFALSTASTQIEKGDTFTLRLNAANMTDLAGWQTDIVFDPALLKANSITEGNFLKQGSGRTFFQKGTINNKQGKIAGIKAARTSTGGANGEGTLLSVRFTAVANGRGRVVLRNFRTGSSTGKTILSPSPETLIVVEQRVPTVPAWDVNADGVTNATDVELVTAALGQEPPKNPRTDVNGDGVVDGKDLALVAEHLGERGAPAAPVVGGVSNPDTSPELVEHALGILRASDDGSLTFQRGIANLELLLTLFVPEETTLLHNYPNPFNPETWIPYQLAQPSEVTIRIYATSGVLVRTLALGYQPAGIYQYRNRAAYWDGRNAVGESVASGVYFYTLSTESTRDSVTAGDFTATRKMLIRK